MCCVIFSPFLEESTVYRFNTISFSDKIIVLCNGRAYMHAFKITSQMVVMIIFVPHVAACRRNRYLHCCSHNDKKVVIWSCGQDDSHGTAEQNYHLQLNSNTSAWTSASKTSSSIWLVMSGSKLQKFRACFKRGSVF